MRLIDQAKYLELIPNTWQKPDGMSIELFNHIFELFKEPLQTDKPKRKNATQKLTLNFAETCKKYTIHKKLAFHPNIEVIEDLIKNKFLSKNTVITIFYSINGFVKLQRAALNHANLPEIVRKVILTMMDPIERLPLLKNGENPNDKQYLKGISPSLVACTKRDIKVIKSKVYAVKNEIKAWNEKSNKSPNNYIDFKDKYNLIDCNEYKLKNMSEEERTIIHLENIKSGLKNKKTIEMFDFVINTLSYAG